MPELHFPQSMTIPPSVKSELNAYICHAVHGKSIRALAKETGVHPSTILRRVRKLEQRRDDPLVDEAIDALSDISPKNIDRHGGTLLTASNEFVSYRPINQADGTNPDFIRYLRRLDEKGAFLALASDMENALIMRELDDGEIVRTTVIGRSEAQLLALNDWVDVQQTGRVSRYKITKAGRMALKRMVAAQSDTTGFLETRTYLASNTKIGVSGSSRGMIIRKLNLIK